MLPDEPLLSTYLFKRNKSHSWQKRWFVLRRSQLAYYKDPSEHRALKVLPLDQLLSCNAIPDHHRFHFILVTNSRIFHLKAPDESTYHQWLTALDPLIHQDDDDEKDLQQQGKEPFNLPKPTIRADEALPELGNLHLSGTDDNFTSDNNEPSRNQSCNSLPQITETPQVPAYNSLAASSPDHIIGKGYIFRLKKRYNQWKKYYMVLTNHFLFFFKSTRDYELNRIYKKINVNDILDVVELDPLSRTKLHCMLIITPLKRVRFCADSEEELTKWLVLLKALIKTRKLERGATN